MPWLALLFCTVEDSCFSIIKKFLYIYTKIKINSHQIIKTFTFVEKISRFWKRNFFEKRTYEKVQKNDEGIDNFKI